MAGRLEKRGEERRQFGKKGRAAGSWGENSSLGGKKLPSAGGWQVQGKRGLHLSAGHAVRGKRSREPAVVSSARRGFAPFCAAGVQKAAGAITSGRITRLLRSREAPLPLTAERRCDRGACVCGCAKNARAFLCLTSRGTMRIVSLALSAGVACAPWGSSSAGRASPSQGGGRGFKSLLLHQFSGH